MLTDLGERSALSLPDARRNLPAAPPFTRQGRPDVSPAAVKPKKAPAPRAHCIAESQAHSGKAVAGSEFGACCSRFS